MNPHFCERNFYTNAPVVDLDEEIRTNTLITKTMLKFTYSKCYQRRNNGIIHCNYHNILFSPNYRKYGTPHSKTCHLDLLLDKSESEGERRQMLIFLRTCDYCLNFFSPLFCENFRVTATSRVLPKVRPSKVGRFLLSQKLIKSLQRFLLKWVYAFRGNDTQLRK